MLPFGVTKCWKENKRGICAKNKCCTSRVAGYRFLPICLNRYTDKLYIFGKSITWLIEISISSLSSVVTLWDNLGQKSNPYLKKKCYQTLTISFLRTFFVIFIQKTAEVVEKWSRSITPYNFTLYIVFYGCQGTVTAER